MPFSVGSYKKINNSWYLPTSLMEVEFSNARSNIFVGGQVRALDEKMKRWRGKLPYIRKVQSKPEPISIVQDTSVPLHDFRRESEGMQRSELGCNPP